MLATIDPNGRPRLVPICFVALADDPAPVIYLPLDEKPKRNADAHALARVRDIVARPEVTLLVDRWDEDWSRLAWLRLHGLADLLEAAATHERAGAIAALRAKYPQYADHDLESRPLIRIAVSHASSWAATDAEGAVEP